MKKLILVSVFTGFFFAASAQSFEWAKVAGEQAYDYGEGVATDDAGNVYIAGKYEYNAVFDWYTATCQGNHDIFVAKYNSSGVLQWVKTAGGLNGDYAHAIAVDKATGTVYVTGEIENAGAYFDSTFVAGHYGGNDIFVAKYLTDGTFQWATGFGGNGNDKAKGIAIDAAGNSYITGQFTDTAFFGNTTLIADGYDDIFIAKVDGNGNKVWAQRCGSVWDDTGKGVAADAAGNVFVAGYFSGTADFSGTTVYNIGYSDAFLGKWDTNGNLVWIKKGGGPNDDVAWAVTLDAAGNSYITGEFNSNANFGALPAIYSTGMADIYVAKYDNSGNEQWVSTLGGSLIDRARGISTDGTTVYITGQYGASISMNGYNAYAADSSDILVASFSASGSPLWLIASHGGEADFYNQLGFESGIAISVAPGGYVYATGSFLQRDSLGSFPLTGWSQTDIFLAKVNPGIVAGVNNIDLNSEIQLHPNPSNGLITVDVGSGRETVNVYVTDQLGRVVYTTRSAGQEKINLNLSGIEKGIYNVNLISDRINQARKIVLF